MREYIFRGTPCDNMETTFQLTLEMRATGCDSLKLHYMEIRLKY